jgi:uncharacterized repeat protein (TIGR03837 family)
LPSPNPRLPLVKHYFFPGFSARTGGLLREADLLERRDAFQADDGAQAAFWKSLVGKAPPKGALKVSLFSYAGAPLEGLARASTHHPAPVWLIATEGAAATALRSWAGQSSIRRTDHPGGGARREVEVFTIPFLPQDRYDPLLWACDINFVRGEDSFVRAQWAGRPFVWHIYPTDDGAHWVKLRAFLARYAEGLDAQDAGAVSAMWDAWNRGEAPVSGEGGRIGLAEAWPAFSLRHERLRSHAVRWSAGLAAMPDLAAALADFTSNVL